MDRTYRLRRSSTVGRRVLLLVFTALTAFGGLAALRTAPAHAEDRIAALDRMLDSSSEKVRLSAVLALAKLGEPRVDKPLIRALHDPSPRVRTVAAAALGQLDSSAALPTLRELARRDDDLNVRNAATAATMKITSASHAERGHPADRSAADGDAQARRSAPGGERPAHAFSVEPHPELYVLIKSASDESPGTTDPTTRKLHAEIIKRALLDRLRADSSITSAAGEAQRWSLAARYLDLSVTRLAANRIGGTVEVGAELRIAISDDSGKILSLLSGGAKIEVPAAAYDARTLPALRRDALDGAMRGMLDKLFSQLRGPR